jgi:hypothetical protein
VKVKVARPHRRAERCGRELAEARRAFGVPTVAKPREKFRLCRAQPGAIVSTLLILTNGAFV